MEYFFWTFFFLPFKQGLTKRRYLFEPYGDKMDWSPTLILQATENLHLQLYVIYINNISGLIDNLHLMRPRSLQARGYFNTQSKPRSHHIIQGFYLWSQWMRQGSHLHTSCIQGYAIFIIAVLNIAASSFQVAPDHIFIHVIHNIPHDIATLEFIWSNSRAVASSRVPTVCR